MQYPTVNPSHKQFLCRTSFKCPLWLQLIPVLRAGLVLLESAQTVLPAAVTYHVGYVRDEKTLEVRILKIQISADRQG